MNDLQGGRAVEPELAALGPWFHNIHLPDGRQTAPDHPLGDFPANLWAYAAPLLPDDLSGWRVLDVGCNAGFYSIALAQRGADVLGIDVDERYLRQAAWVRDRFELAGRIELRPQSVYALGGSGHSFDLVLFMGVLYHLRYPLLALDVLRELTAQLLLFQSLLLPGDVGRPVPQDVDYRDLERLAQPDWPRAAFVEHRLAADPTNWWIPDRAAVEAMLRASGFADLRVVHDGAYLARPDPREDTWRRDARAAELGSVFAAAGHRRG